MACFQNSAPGGRSSSSKKARFRLANALRSCAGIDEADFFTPAEFTMKRRGTVTFSTDRGVSFWPASNRHPDHGLYPDFDPKQPLDPKEIWTFTFDRAGDWAFHDHLRSYFTGTVHVAE